MKTIILLLMIAGSLWACSQEVTNKKENTPASSDDYVSVTMSVCSVVLDMVTRTDENTVSDVNLYLVQNGIVKQHIYSTGSKVQFKCTVGYYKLFVIANHHTDLGLLNYVQLSDYSIHSKDNYSDLPMTGETTINVTASSQELILPPVEVKRAVAKINYYVQVDTSVRDIELQSLQVMNLPKWVKPFTDMAPSEGLFDYFNGAITPHYDVSYHMSGSFYMLPNLQGIEPSITTPANKNFSTAPGFATYLRIRAVRGSKILDYFVFLGENSTDSFDVRPNSAHTMNITIKNDNVLDVRVHSYTIDTECYIEAEPENGFYLKTAPMALRIFLSGQTENAGLSCILTLKKGDNQFFIITAEPINCCEYNINLYDIEDYNFVSIVYNPSSLSSDAAVLNFTLTFYDKYGIVTEREFTFHYAYSFSVYTKWFNGGQGYGTLTSPNAMAVVESWTLSTSFYKFYCTDEGCTIIAHPDEGRRFDGWYQGHDFTRILSRDYQLQYYPGWSTPAIYASFR